MDIVINGSLVAQEMALVTAAQVESVKQKYGVNPSIAFITAAKDNPAKLSELALHTNAAKKVGLEVREFILDESVSEDEVLKWIDTLNTDENVHGILAILPLPAHINEEAILLRVAAAKELEGLRETKTNIKELFQGRQIGVLSGLISLLQSVNYDIYANYNVLIMEEHTLTGNPVVVQILELASKLNFPLEICSPGDANVQELTRKADLLIVSVDTPKFINESFIKKGAILVDFNPLIIGEEYSEKKGRMVPIFGSSLDMDSLAKKAKNVIPTLGGIGPVALSFLIRNVVYNCKLMIEKK